MSSISFQEPAVTTIYVYIRPGKYAVSLFACPPCMVNGNCCHPPLWRSSSQPFAKNVGCHPCGRVCGVLYPKEAALQAMWGFLLSDCQYTFFFCSVHVGAERACEAVILFASAAVLFGKCKHLPREYFEKHP